VPPLLKRDKTRSRNLEVHDGAGYGVPAIGEWHPRMLAQVDEEELADWRAGRNAVYQLLGRSEGAATGPLQCDAPPCGPSP
jgi:hypothetical protein